MRRKLWIALVMMTVLPMLFISCIVLEYAQAAILNMKQETLNGAVNMMDYRLTNEYITLLEEIQEKTKIDAVTNFMDSSTDDIQSADWQESQHLRMLLLEDLSYPVSSGSIMNRAGDVLVSSIPSEEGMSLDKTHFYKTIMEGKESYLSIVAVNQNTDIIEFAVPIKDENNYIIGILRQTFQLDPLKQYLNQLNKKGVFYAFLIRSNGMLVFQFDKENESMIYREYKNKNYLDDLIMNFRNGQMKSDTGKIEFDKDGEEYIAAYKLVKKINCIAVAAVKRDIVLLGLKTMQEIMILIGLTIAFFVVLGGFYTSMILTKPLKEINGSIKKMADGNLTIRCSYKGGGEFHELCGSVNNLADNLQKSERELRLSSRIDSVTHLPNRNAIYEVLDTLLYKHPNQALLMLDLDQFEDINDNLGHDVGDKVLMEIADVLRTLPQHICYPSRLGGDEFLIFITNWTTPKYPEKIAERIIKEIEGIRFIDEIIVDISVSIGIEYTNVDKLDKKKLIKHSDLAMHKSKSLGRNSYFVYYTHLQCDFQ